jgi:hypothetical protein
MLHPTCYMLTGLDWYLRKCFKNERNQIGIFKLY